MMFTSSDMDDYDPDGYFDLTNELEDKMCRLKEEIIFLESEIASKKWQANISNAEETIVQRIYI